MQGSATTKHRNKLPWLLQITSVEQEAEAMSWEQIANNSLQKRFTTMLRGQKIIMFTGQLAEKVETVPNDEQLQTKPNLQPGHEEGLL